MPPGIERPRAVHLQEVKSRRVPWLRVWPVAGAAGWPVLARAVRWLGGWGRAVADGRPNCLLGRMPLLGLWKVDVVVTAQTPLRPDSACERCAVIAAVPQPQRGSQRGEAGYPLCARHGVYRIVRTMRPRPMSNQLPAGRAGLCLRGRPRPHPRFDAAASMRLTSHRRLRRRRRRGWARRACGSIITMLRPPRSGRRTIAGELRRRYCLHGWAGAAGFPRGGGGLLRGRALGADRGGGLGQRALRPAGGC